MDGALLEELAKGGKKATKNMPNTHNLVDTYSTRGPHGPRFSLIHSKKSFKICRQDMHYSESQIPWGEEATKSHKTLQIYRDAVQGANNRSKYLNI